MLPLICNEINLATCKFAAKEEKMSDLISVIVLAYGPELFLSECVASIMDSIDVELELIVIDNGSPAVVDLPVNDPRIRVHYPGFNTGFSGGCNLGVQLAKGKKLVFLNSDAIVEPNAIANLVKPLGDKEVGLTAGVVLLGSEHEKIFSIGNPIHYLFFSWTGGLGDIYQTGTLSSEITGIPGSFFSSSIGHWEAIGGFEEEFFAYAEDANISIKSWQMGKKVLIEPSAVAYHHYDHKRHLNKMFLVERNRLINLLTLYKMSSLVILLPVIIPTEVGILLVAIRQGWGRQKFRGWVWLINNLSYLRESRRKVSAKKSDRSWINRLGSDMKIPEDFEFNVPVFVNRSLRFYFQAVGRFLG